MDAGSSNHEKLFNEICDKLNSLSQLTQEPVSAPTPDSTLSELTEERLRLNDRLIELSTQNEFYKKDFDQAQQQVAALKERLQAQYLRYESIEHNYINQIEELQITLQNLQSDYQDLHRKWSKHTEFKSRLRRGLSKFRRQHMDEKSSFHSQIRNYVSELEKTKNELRFAKAEGQAELDRYIHKGQTFQAQIRGLEADLKTAQEELQTLSQEKTLRCEAESQLLTAQARETSLKEKIENLTKQSEEFKTETTEKTQSLEEDLQFYKNREAELQKEKTQLVSQFETEIRQVRESWTHSQRLLEEREHLLTHVSKEKAGLLQNYEALVQNFNVLQGKKQELEVQNAALFQDLTHIQTKTAQVKHVVQDVTEKYRKDIDRVEMLIEFERNEGKKRNLELDNRKRLIEEKNRKIREQDQEIADLKALVEDLRLKATGTPAPAKTLPPPPPNFAKPVTVKKEEDLSAKTPVKPQPIFATYKGEDISVSADTLRKYEEIQRRNMDLDSLNGL